MLRRIRLSTQNSFRDLISAAVRNVQQVEDLTDQDVADQLGSSATSVCNWRNKNCDIGGLHLLNAMKVYPSFKADIQAAIEPREPEEICPREACLVLDEVASIVMKAITDPDTPLILSNKELLDAEPVLARAAAKIDKMLARARQIRNA